MGNTAAQKSNNLCDMREAAVKESHAADTMPIRLFEATSDEAVRDFNTSLMARLPALKNSSLSAERCAALLVMSAWQVQSPVYKFPLHERHIQQRGLDRSSTKPTHTAAANAERHKTAC